MTDPSAAERARYPLLSQREDWPPASRNIPSGLTYAEREEHIRFWADREREAEVAARRQMTEHRVPEWFEDKQAEANARPLVRVEEQEQARHDPAVDPDWFLRTGYDHPPLGRDEVQPSLRDFERSPQDDERMRERQTYEEDVFRRAVAMHRTRSETELLRLAGENSPEMRKRVEGELFQRRMQRIRQRDDDRRHRELEKRMDRHLKERFDEELRRDEDPDRYPVPGPYWEPTPPTELDRAQDEMLRDYERDDDR